MLFLFLLTACAVGCGRDAPDAKRLIGMWTGNVETLTLFANGTFWREVKIEVASRPGVFQTFQGVKGRWENRDGALHFYPDQVWSDGEYREIGTLNVNARIWASGEYRWELKETKLNMMELHLKRPGDSQSLVYRKHQ
jgi:hypothetical protein